MRTPQIGPDLRLAKTMWKNTTTEQKANEEKLKKKNRANAQGTPL